MRWILPSGLTLLLLNGADVLGQKPDTQPERRPMQRSGAGLQRASLGLLVEEMPPDSPHGGLIVRDVRPGSPAEQGGIMKDDLIVRACNRQVEDYDELVNTLAGCEPGEKVSFLVVRDGRMKSVKVELGQAKDGDAAGKREPFLGVLVVPANAMHEVMRDRLGILADEGLVIIDVVPESPAARAGLRHGDLLRRLGKEELASPEDLRDRIHRAGVGKEVALTVQRGDRTKDLQIALGEQPVDVRLKQPAWRMPEYQTRLDDTLQALRRQIERLEQRVRMLEQKMDRPPAK